MKVTDLLTIKTIELNASATSKEDVLKKAVILMAKSGCINDIKAYEKAVFLREEESTTGIGEGIAIPHAKGDFVSKPHLAAMIIKDGVEFNSLDNEKVKLLFLIAAPNTKDNVHLDVLAKLSQLLMNESFYNNLLNAKTKQDFLNIIDAAENDKNNHVSKVYDSYDILAVTACPTGIAHTYMAQEALEVKAKQMGIKIKVETEGSGGIKNALTNEEIKNSKAIIVAADKKVPMARFNGKRVIITKVAKGIHEPEELIKKALDESTPIFYSDEEGASLSSNEDESIGRKIYKYLMNGVSHMLPFVIGGGILIALAFLIDSFYPEAIGEDFGTYTQVARFLKTLGGYAFAFMLPILAGYIAYSIADRPGLAVGFVGGYLATLTDYSIISSIDGSSAGFLGAIAAGFIGGYIIVGLRKLFNFLPKSLDGLKPTLIYPLFGILLIGFSMYFIVNGPFAWLNTQINTILDSLGTENKVILGFLVALMMAIDMGGPINKAAYVFGTAAIASQQYWIMASVMIGGMVPPLAIALATTIFPQKFSKKERIDGKVNYVMGLSFITEGAIPFAASDPWRVILSCVVGSGVAGAISALLNCTLMAPHGGIFVFAVVGNWYWYLLALVIGTIVGALLLGVLKKDHDNPELGKFKGIRFRKE